MTPVIAARPGATLLDHNVVVVVFHNQSLYLHALQARSGPGFRPARHHEAQARRAGKSNPYRFAPKVRYVQSSFSSSRLILLSFLPSKILFPFKGLSIFFTSSGFNVKKMALTLHKHVEM